MTKKELLMHAIRWMNLKDIRMSEKKWTQRALLYLPKTQKQAKLTYGDRDKTHGYS